MLGRSHKEVVEMLKSVPMGQSVDVVLRRGYPMLYNPDGCPKHSLDTVRTCRLLRSSRFSSQHPGVDPPGFFVLLSLFVYVPETAKDS